MWGFLMSQQTPTSHWDDYLDKIAEAHCRSGRSLREVAAICDVEHSYVSRILNGERRPGQTALVALCVFAWGLDRAETDEILLLAGLPPIGRSALREYRQSFRGKIK